MTEFLPELEIDRVSFWSGFFTGILFIFLIFISRKYLPAIFRSIRVQLKQSYELLTSSIDVRYRNDVIRYAQKQHLTGSFFALDDIAIEPRLISPPPQASWYKTPPPVDVVHQILPYLPDWPEMASAYHAPTISVAESLLEGANVVILGQPGSGKSFALAWLAIRIAGKDIEADKLGSFIPIYFHAADIPYEASQINPIITETNDLPDHEVEPEKTIPSPINLKTPIEILLSILAYSISSPTLLRLPSFLESAFTNKQVLLIIDGLDELSRDQLKHAVDFIAQLIHDYPDNRIITSASFDCYDRLTALGLIPLAMSSWGDEAKEIFVTRWNQQWNALILPGNASNFSQLPEPKFITSWLLSKSYPTTPFDFTLKVWSAYAGDIPGTDQADLIESYLNRCSRGVQGTRNSMQQLAFQMVSHQCLRVKPQDANRWVSRRFSSTSTDPIGKDSPTESVEKRSPPQTREHASLNTLMNSGIIFSHPDSRIGYPHPIFIGYLAACYLSNENDHLPIQAQPDWIGKTLTNNYLAHFKDLSPDIYDRNRHDDILNEEILHAARWLSLISANKTWRSVLLRSLVGTINKPNTPVALRAKCITAIALSGDQGSGVLFRQLLKSPYSSIRQLAALGCGLVRDVKAVDDLNILCQESDPALASSACLALVEIGGKQSIESLISILMQGNEISRRCSAESLANHRSEGHAILKEGSQHTDLMVRRSSVYGLARIRQPWSVDILESLQLEDKEWIVRNASAQCLEEIRHPNPHIPHPISALEEASWLIEYAGRQGLGVSHGQQAYKLVLDVLIMGTTDEKLAALEYLGMSGQKEAANYIYPLFVGQTGEVQEAAYQALWQIHKTGIEFALD